MVIGIIQLKRPTFKLTGVHRMHTHARTHTHAHRDRIHSHSLLIVFVFAFVCVGMCVCCLNRTVPQTQHPNRFNLTDQHSSQPRYNTCIHTRARAHTHTPAHQCRQQGNPLPSAVPPPTHTHHVGNKEPTARTSNSGGA